MSRRDHEPVFVALFATRPEAEDAWARLVEAGVPSAVVTDDAPWGQQRHGLQCERKDAAHARRVLDPPPGDSSL